MLGFKGEFSRHFGGDAPRNSMTFTAPSSQVSDLYFKGIVDSHVVEDLVAKPAPLGPRRYPGRRGAASSRGTLTS